MSSPYDFLQRAARVSIEQEVHESLIATRDTAIQLQKSQLFSGVKNDETPIAPPYASATVKKKIKKGQPFDRVTGFDTGAMYAQTFDDIRKTNFIWGSTSQTFAKFVERYGANTFGLTPTNIENLREKTAPVFIESLIDKLAL